VLLEDDAPAAGVLDDAALDDDDELDPHPAITAAVIATASTPALMRARSNLNMGPTLLSRPAREPLRVESAPCSGEANRFDRLAASPRR
jgi:hypothetical protein